MKAVQATFWDDIAVGEDVSPLVLGPFTAPILMRWSAAMENWHRIHYDRDFAVNHDRLPDLLINGSLKQQLIMQLLRRWAAPGGWVWKVSFQFRAMNTVGETLRMWARAVGKRELTDFGIVALELGIVAADKESTPGKALVALPYRDRTAAGVPYPFVAPDGIDW